MARIVVAVVRGGELDGSFATLTGVVDLAWDVETFAARVKESRGAYLAGIEPWQMTVFGPWADQPRVAEVPLRMREEPCRAADLLGTLVGGMESAFFLVRITTPHVAAGESVALAWHAWSVPTILVV
jgi:hypothetical protein